MRCGVGEYAESLARSLRAEGHAVGVLTSEAARTRPETPGLDVFPVVRLWRHSEFDAVKRVVREWKPDIAHIQFPTLGYRGRLPWKLPFLLLRYRLPVVQTWHEFVPEGATRKPSYWLQALSPGGVVVVRPGYRERIPRLLRWASMHKRMEFIPSAPTIPRVVLAEGHRAALRDRYLRGRRRLVSFFGFFYQHKGIDDLLGILDPREDRLLLIGEPQGWDPFQVDLLERIARSPLSAFVEVTGHLPAPEVGALLAASDVVALPFRRGGGTWNTSLQAAMIQGTFVLTTSLERHGFDENANVYYARPGDLDDLRVGLGHAGLRSGAPRSDFDFPCTWEEVARRHLAFYAAHLPRRRALGDVGVVSQGKEL